MQYFRNNISRFFIFIIAVQILNMSIGTSNPQIQEEIGSSDNFNYIDTYAEYVAEVVLKFDNAFPESKDRQQKDLQLHKQFQIIHVQRFDTTEQLAWKENTIILSLYSSDKYAFQFIKEINPPPLPA